MNIAVRKNVCNSIFAFLLVLNLFLSNTEAYGFATGIPMLVGVVLTMAYVVCTILHRRISIFDEIKASFRQQEGLLYLLFIVIGISYIIPGTIYRVPTFLLYGVFFAAVLPLWTLVSSEDVIKDFLPKFMNSAFILIVITVVASLLFAPMDTKQYYGVYINPNTFGTMLSFAAIVVIYKYETANKKSMKFFTVAVFGVLSAFVFFTKSRTTLMVMFAFVIVYLIYIGKNKKEFLDRVRDYGIALILAIPLVFFCLGHITPLIVENTGVDYFIELKQSRYAEDQEIAKNENTTLQQEMNSVVSRYFKGIGDNGRFSSGRTLIWYSYIKEISFKCHSGDDLYVEGWEEINAHNSFLQVAYQGGIVAGISLFIIVIMVFIRIRKTGKMEKKRLNQLLYRMIFVNAIIIMTLGGGFTPYRDFQMLMLWMILIPYIYGRKQVEQKV